MQKCPTSQTQSPPIIPKSIIPFAIAITKTRIYLYTYKSILSKKKVKMNRCPTFQNASILGRKWTLPLLQQIELRGDKGFNFILNSMKKARPKILSARLKQLEQAGIVKKTYIKRDFPLKTSYKLTQKGQELNEIVASMKKWNAKYFDLPCETTECVKCELY